MWAIAAKGGGHVRKDGEVVTGRSGSRLVVSLSKPDETLCFLGGFRIMGRASIEKSKRAPELKLLRRGGRAREGNAELERDSWKAGSVGRHGTVLAEPGTTRKGGAGGSTKRRRAGPEWKGRRRQSFRSALPRRNPESGTGGRKEGEGMGGRMEIQTEGSKSRLSREGAAFRRFSTKKVGRSAAARCTLPCAFSGSSAAPPRESGSPNSETRSAGGRWGRTKRFTLRPGRDTPGGARTGTRPLFVDCFGRRPGTAKGRRAVGRSVPQSLSPSPIARSKHRSSAPESPSHGVPSPPTPPGLAPFWTSPRMLWRRDRAAPYSPGGAGALIQIALDMGQGCRPESTSPAKRHESLHRQSTPNARQRDGRGD